MHFQALEIEENHNEILEDLYFVHQQVQLTLNKIETSTNKLSDHHEATLAQYEQTLEKLNEINNTVRYIWNLTNSMRAEVDEKLNWLTSYIGDTGNSEIYKY